LPSHLILMIFGIWEIFAYGAVRPIRGLWRVFFCVLFYWNLWGFLYCPSLLCWHYFVGLAIATYWLQKVVFERPVCSASAYCWHCWADGICASYCCCWSHQSAMTPTPFYAVSASFNYYAEMQLNATPSKYLPTAVYPPSQKTHGNPWTKLILFKPRDALKHLSAHRCRWWADAMEWGVSRIATKNWF
jgi:hypothetical protein